MDLSHLFEYDSASMPVLDRDGNPAMGSDGNPWTILLAGPNHPASFRASDDMQRRVVKRISERGKEASDTDEELVADALRPLVSRTLGWSPIILNGAPFEFSPENAMLLYSSSELVRRQVDRFLMVSANFTKRP